MSYLINLTVDESSDTETLAFLGMASSLIRTKLVNLVTRSFFFLLIVGILHGISHLGFLRIFQFWIWSKWWICINSIPLPNKNPRSYLSNSWCCVFPPKKHQQVMGSSMREAAGSTPPQLPGLAWNDWGERPVMPGKKSRLFFPPEKKQMEGGQWRFQKIQIMNEIWVKWKVSPKKSGK